MKIVPFDAQAHTDQVLALLNITLPAVGSRDFFRWKHFDSPFGASKGLLAFAQGQLIGVRLFMMWQFSDGQTILPAIRPVDTVTHPSMRGRGVFKRLTLEGLDRYATGKLVFNTPNGNSAPGYLKMGWVESPGEAAYHYTYTSPFGREVATVRSLPPKTVPIHEYVHAAWITQKDQAFINWRYRNGGDYLYATFKDDLSSLLIAEVEVKLGFRVCKVIDYIGPQVNYRRLTDATGRALGCPVIREIVTIGRTGRRGIKRGTSLVITRDEEHLLNKRIDFSTGDLQSNL